MLPTSNSTTAERQVGDRRRQLTFGDFVFDPASRLLRRGPLELPLPPRVLGVLELLLERASDIVPRQELIDRVWKDAFVTDTSLAEAISVLRQTLGDDAQSPIYIQTVHRRGYRFVAPVRAIEPAAVERTWRENDEAKLVEERVPSIAYQLLPWSVAALSAAVAIAALWQATAARKSTSLPEVRFSIVQADGLAFDRRAPALAVSPDGRRVAWSACDSSCRLYVRPLDSLQAQAIPATEGAHAPFFSPDAEWIGFFADGRLKKVSISGGEPVTLSDAPEPLGGTWHGREIIFTGSMSSGLSRVSENGGTPVPLTTPDYSRGEVRHSWPSIVPGESIVLFTIDMTPGAEGGALGAMALNDGAAGWRMIVSGVGIARPAARDVLVFSRGTDLLAASFDPLRLTLNGEPRVAASDVATAGDRAHVAFSLVGDLILAEAGQPADARLFWTTSTDGRIAVTLDTRRMRNIRLSPDGRQVAATSVGESRTDIWVADLDRGASTRLTHDRINSTPVWSTDGGTVYFASRDTGPFEVWRRDVGASGPAARVLRSESHVFPASISPDDAQLAVVLSTANAGNDIALLRLSDGNVRPVVQSPFDDDEPAFSPDGSLLAYRSADTGRWQVYVQRLADGRRTIASTAGGQHPVWARDGAALYYSTETSLMRVGVSAARDGPRAATPEPVSGAGTARIAGVAPDGRLLIDPEGAPPSRALVAVGWLRGVRQLLGPPSAVMPR